MLKGGTFDHSAYILLPNMKTLFRFPTWRRSPRYLIRDLLILRTLCPTLAQNFCMIWSDVDQSWIGTLQHASKIAESEKQGHTTGDKHQDSCHGSGQFYEPSQSHRNTVHLLETLVQRVGVPIFAGRLLLIRQIFRNADLSYVLVIVRINSLVSSRTGSSPITRQLFTAIISRSGFQMC